MSALPSLRLWLWLVSALVVGVGLGLRVASDAEAVLRCLGPRAFCAGYWWQFGAVWGAGEIIR